MKLFCAPRLLATAIGLLFLCSCAAPPPRPQPPLIVPLSNIPATRLPATVSMNKEAGRGNWIFVSVALADGEKLPFVVDTGAFSSLLDRSLEPMLGTRLDSGTLRVFGIPRHMNQYQAPTLYLADTPLMMTGPYIFTDDLKGLSHYAGRPVMGMLGMDVLAHYCVQLDFAANRMRFLDDRPADKRAWGKAFPLTDVGDGCVAIRQNLTGAAGAGSLIDTGCTYDGWLIPDLYSRWTNRAAPLASGQVRFPDAILGGTVYTNVNLEDLRPKLFSSGDPHLKLNGVGLSFLSRNVVTLDFPRMTMYLKPVSIGPFIDWRMRRTAHSEALSAIRFLKAMAAKGKLPGWSRTDQPAQTTEAVQFHFSYPHIVTVDDLRKKGDPTLYHYRVTRLSTTSPWKIIKAWQTSALGKVIKRYPVQ